ncbi:MAG: translation initiation factor IF-3 [Mycoplasmoidaceae bacterium]|nr:translation initiation factor IF-3 [Mycoplasmoidaceae bacterium]
MEYRPINEKIRDPKLLVIDEDGSKIGQMTRNDAINYARDKDLDLVLFVPANKTGGLPIAKVIDYGKFNYMEKMKAKQSKKNQSVIKVKEIKVRPQIGKHDLE